MISYTSIAVFSMCTAFYYGWELTLVSLVVVPLTIVSTSVLSHIQTKLTSQELATYAVCGGMAEEIISSIRTVVAFGGQEKEFQRFQDALHPARNTGIKRGLFTGLASGIYWFLLYLTYALAFWYLKPFQRFYFLVLFSSSGLKVDFIFRYLIQVRNQTHIG